MERDFRKKKDPRESIFIIALSIVCPSVTKKDFRNSLIIISSC